MKIKSALISVFHKDGLDTIAKQLKTLGVKIYSTGGTQQFLESLDIQVTPVEDITGYPSVFGGRVKTLHPAVFGGILQRRNHENDAKEAADHKIPTIDLVIVDLYPFQDTVASTNDETSIIEKIDIGGISLIRAAAKNFKDVVIVPSKDQYARLEEILNNNGETSLEERKKLAAAAFEVSSDYDTAIYKYFTKDEEPKVFKASLKPSRSLRYGENPHQQARFYGNLDDMFEQLHGKELSYNNLVDIDAAVALVQEFEETAFAIIKHTNACGVATGDTVKEAYLKALEADPISAFGGILTTNRMVDLEAAEEIHKLFCEVVIAPDFSAEAKALLSSKKNRVLLKQKTPIDDKPLFKTLLNGVIEQDKDAKMAGIEDMQVMTKRAPESDEYKALLFANKVCKHTKSNVIVYAKKDRLVSSGVGQTSRIDAAKQAIEKAERFNLDLNGAVMASDAFFPFPDCVEVAFTAGIRAVIQPGGSIKDKDSVEFCDKHNMAMVFTGLRHFKH